MYRNNKSSKFNGKTPAPLKLQINGSRNLKFYLQNTRVLRTFYLNLNNLLIIVNLIMLLQYWQKLILTLTLMIKNLDQTIIQFIERIGTFFFKSQIWGWYLQLKLIVMEHRLNKCLSNFNIWRINTYWVSLIPDLNPTQATMIHTLREYSRCSNWPLELA